MAPSPAWLRRARRVALGLFVPTVVGVAGAWLGLLAFGRSTVPMGPFRVQLAAGFGPARTDVQLPPFGRLSADTHAGPLLLSASLHDVGVERLTELLRERTTQEIVDEVESDLRASISPFALQVLAIGVVGGLALGALVFRVAWKRVLVSVLGAMLAVGGGEVMAWRTYEPLAFRTPRYTGSLGVAADLIGPVRQATTRIEAIRAELERLVEGTLRAYRSIQVGPLGEGLVSVLHISDIHLSPLGLSFAREVARAFDVDLVVDTGDLTSFGTPAEELIAELIPTFERPYLFAPGNHDADDLADALADAPNAVVLDGGTVEVAGLTVYGLGHPVFTPNQRPPLPDRAFESQARSAAEIIEVHLSSLDRPPDIVAVHDDRMAEALAGTIPLVISGHFHETSARILDGTILLRVGSTGGSGATVFTEEGGIPFEAQILYFETGRPGTAEGARLVAFDVIQQSPETGSMTVTRHLVGEELPTASTTPSASPTTTPP